jgi:cell division protein FtsQ
VNRAVKVSRALAGVALALGLVATAPSALQRMDGFRVRRVEVRGTRYLAPHEALQASGITRQSNIFQNFAPWRDSLERHPLIARARVERALPGTIRLLITEVEPIALVLGLAGSAGELRAVTADGTVLPLDPTSIDLNLPVVSAPAPTAPPTSKATANSKAAQKSTAAPASKITNARVLAALRLLERIRQAEPVLFGWISDTEPAGSAVRIRLRTPAGAEALLPAEPDAVQLRKLRLTLATLAASQDIDRLLRIDARFRDQIVVALTPTAAS